MNNQAIHITNDTVTNYIIDASLELAFPTLLSGNDFSPIFLFAAYPLGLNVKSAQIETDADETIVKEEILVINSEEFELYPNPTTGIVNITSTSNGTTYYQLTSNTGKILEQNKYQGTNLRLDLSVYERGVYFIALNDGVNEKFYKIIKL